MRRLLIQGLGILFLSVSSPWAATLHVDKLNIIGIVPPSVEAQLNNVYQNEIDQINDNLNVPDQAPFLKAMANAQTFAAKGLGVDYASNPTLFVVGASVGFGLGTRSFSNIGQEIEDSFGGQNTFPQIGIGLQATGMVGFAFGTIFKERAPLPVKQPTRQGEEGDDFYDEDEEGGGGLGQIEDDDEYEDCAPDDPDPECQDFEDEAQPQTMVRTGGMVGQILSRLVVYANFFGISKQIDDFNASITSVGVHAQYKIIKVVNWAPWGLARWGGVDLTTGLDFSRMHLQLEKDDIQVDHTDGTYTAFWNPIGRLGINTKTYSIPIEASTNIQVGHVLSLFVGGAVDVTYGRSKTIGELAGPIVIKEDSTNNPVATSAARLDLGEAKTPTIVTGRIFLGPQINISALKLYVQLNYAFNNTVAGHFGIRVAW